MEQNLMLDSQTQKDDADLTMRGVAVRSIICVSFLVDAVLARDTGASVVLNKINHES